MQLNSLLTLGLSIFCSAVFAQSGNWQDEQLQRNLAATITVEDLRNHLYTLADDNMEGRETGQPGQYRAARYLEGVIKGYGLPAVGPGNTYSQPISFISERWRDVELTINGEEQRHLWDYYAYPTKNADRSKVAYSELIFLGYGIDDPAYSDYSGANVQGKAIVIFDGEPRNADGISYITGQEQGSDWSASTDKKLRAARTKGVATVIIIDPDFQRNLASARKIALDSGLRMGFSEQPEDNYANSIYVSSETARRLLGKAYGQVVKARGRITKKGKPRSVAIPVSLELTQRKDTRELLGENMLAFVEGSDPALKNEILVVTAHYDHIGKRADAVFNGADDNASGTSTVLEVCQAFVTAKQRGVGPRRSVLFMLVSGEEKGLLGSKFYVEHPIFPLAQTIANINVDMVGRVDDKHAADPNYIYVIGADRLSTTLHSINEQANARYTQLELDYTYNDENDPNRYYYRSDHYNFAERNIPAVFFFNGTHEDYHMDTDTADKINFEKMVGIGQLVFHTAWELANRDERIKVDVVSGK